MKRTETYRLPLKLRNTEEESIIEKEINSFLGKRYLDLGTNPARYLYMENGSLILIKYGKDICKDLVIVIETTSQTEIPKELSDFLVSQKFARIG